MKDNEQLYYLIRNAQKGNTKATFEIILRFEPLINKYSKINGKFSQECKDYIIDDLIKNIKNFEKNKK